MQPQEQPGASEVSLAQPFISPDAGKSDLLRWIIETADIIEEIELVLSNKMVKYDAEKKQYVEVSLGKPHMNKDGIREIQSVLRSLTTKNTITSDLTEERIYVIIRDLLEKIVILLKDNYKKFEISPDKLPLIVANLGNLVEITLSRAKDGFTVDLLRNIERRTETHVTQPSHEGRRFGLFKKDRR